MIPRQSAGHSSTTRSKQKAERVATWIGLAILAILVCAIVFASIWLYRKFADSVGHASGNAVVVPNVVGMTQEQAEQTLISAGLGAQVTQNANTDEQDAGKVFRQDPESGMTMRPGRQVKLMVSLGPPSYTVPKLINESLDKAQQTLTKARLRLGVVERIYYKGAKRGTILSQNPAPGTPTVNPTPVDVTVADTAAAQTIVVPSVIGTQLAQAQDEIVKNNLRLAKVTYQADDDLAAGTVITQDPTANADANVGDKITLVVALPSAVMTAPAKTVSISVRVPAGPDKQKVKIKVFDNLGGQVREDSEHNPGDLVEQNIPIEGAAKIQIYVGDMNTPFREDIL